MTGDPIPPQQHHFCTRCGDELENFCFSPDAQNLDALRAAALRCRMAGTLAAHGICSKLFIADTDHPAAPALVPGPRPPAEDLEALRREILRRIEDILP